MKQLSRNQSLLFLVGAVLMVVGAGLYVFGVQKLAPWVFAVGAFAFAGIQMQQHYDGTNPTVQRLRRIMLLADACFMLSAIFMIENAYHFLLSLFLRFGAEGYNAYLTYIHNNWVVLLLVAAVLELYTTHRISNELDKEAKKR